MKEKDNENSNRIIEASSIKGDQIEKIDEFWSTESLKKRPIDEQYPKLENETDNQYESRLQEIQALTELAQADLSEEDKLEIENGAYTEKSGKAAVPNYRKYGINVLRTFDMAERRPDLLYLDKGKYGLERQKAQEEKADYYIFSYQHKQPELSEFSGFVSDDRLSRSQAILRKKEKEIREEKEQRNPEDRAMEERTERWDRTAEAILYPLVLNFGLFDRAIVNSGEEKPSAKWRARALYPSKFDDLFHGIDAAFMIPIGANKRGEIQYIPITLDCTTSTTHRGVESKFRSIKADGRTRLDYSKAEDDKLITDIHPLNFIIGVDNNDLIGNEGLMAEDNIIYAPKNLFHDFYVQIYVQARLRQEYYRVLLYDRGKSKDVKYADILSKDELLDARQAFAVCDYFEQKCKETATNKDRPFDLSHTYNDRSPTILVYNKAIDLLDNQRAHIRDIKYQKGWQ